VAVRSLLTQLVKRREELPAKMTMEAPEMLDLYRKHVANPSDSREAREAQRGTTRETYQTARPKRPYSPAATGYMPFKGPRMASASGTDSVYRREGAVERKMCYTWNAGRVCKENPCQYPHLCDRSSCRNKKREHPGNTCPYSSKTGGEKKSY
jgi:hypothetical protein